MDFAQKGDHTHTHSSFPPASRRARQLSLLFQGTVFDGYISWTSLSVGYSNSRQPLNRRTDLGVEKKKKGRTRAPNEDFNTQSCRPGQGVISPLVPVISARAEEEERWVKYRRGQLEVLGELVFHSFSAGVRQCGIDHDQKKNNKKTKLLNTASQSVSLSLRSLH